MPRRRVRTRATLAVALTALMIGSTTPALAGASPGGWSVQSQLDRVDLGVDASALAKKKK